MVQTRQALARVPRPPGEQSAKTAEIVTPRDGIHKIFEQLKEIGVVLPFRVRESPSKRRKSPGDDAVKHINFLYWQHPDSLVKILEDFELQSPGFADNDTRLNNLLETLSLAVSARKPAGTPSSRSHWPPSSLQAEPAPQELDAPASPTLSVKHAPKLPIEDFAGYPMLPPPIPFASKPNFGTVSATTSFDSTATAMDQTLGTTTANTSFDAMDPRSGTTTANTSFNADFWSQPKASQDQPVSPATSYHSLEGANDSLEHNKTPYLSLDGANDFVDYTQETKYEGPMSSLEAAQLEVDPTQQTSYEGPMSSMASTQLDEVEWMAKQKSDTPVQSPKQLTAGPARSPSPPKVKPETPAKSPSKHYKLEKIPYDGLSNIEFPPSMAALQPFCLRLEVHRVLQTGLIASADLDQEWMAPRTMDSLHAIVEQHKIPFERGVETDFSDRTLRARLRWTKSNSSSESLLALHFLVPTRELRNDFQRKFGGDRILYIDSDSP